ncbi:MAG: methyl-accepting chemotaxis protein [Desulfuromonadales bacterium]
MKWTIGNKLGAFCVLIITVLTIFGIISYRNNLAMEANAEMVKHTFSVVDELENIPTYNWAAESGMRGYFLTEKPEYLAQHRDAVKSITKSLEELKKLIRNEKARQLLGNAETLINKRLVAYEEVYQAFRDNKQAGAVAYINSGNPLKLTSEITRTLGEIDSIERDLLRNHDKELHASNIASLNIIIIGIPLVICLLSVTGYLLTRSITLPLRELTIVADQISQGDLTNRPSTLHRDDEIGVFSRAFTNMNEYLKSMSKIAESISANNLSVTCEPLSERDSLGNAFNAMIANLLAMVREIREASKLVSGATARIASLTAQLATSTSETAAAVSETSTSLEEIKTTAQLVNQKSSYVSECAKETAEVTESGRRNVAETIHGMNKIRQQMDFIAEGIVKLSEQSMAIGEIIESVSDIASQSNLLAVNASIEAAKAGEHGKGFAVVAQEVRSLAEQSKGATVQIKRILNDIQKSISTAVMATEQGGKTVESGVRQSAETESSIQIIEQGAVGTVQASAQIVASTSEQVVGLNQVAVAIDSIRSASDQIVTSTRQAEEATHDLNEMGKKLWHLVERFKVN